MKGCKLYFAIALVSMIAAVSCDSFDENKREFPNAVYLDIAKTSDVQTTVFKKSLQTLDRQLHI